MYIRIYTPEGSIATGGAPPTIFATQKGSIATGGAPPTIFATQTYMHAYRRTYTPETTVLCRTETTGYMCEASFEVLGAVCRDETTASRPLSC